MPAGRELLAAVDAAVLRDDWEIESARSQLIDAVGEPGAFRAFSVAASFEMMNRIMDAVGAPPKGFADDLPEAIGVPWPPHRS